MKIFKSASLALFTMVVFAFTSTALQAQNDAYKNWSQFNVGTTATLKTVSKMGGREVSQVKITQKLVEKNDQQVVIEIATSIVVNGMEIPSPTNKVTYKKNVKSSIEKPANLPKNMKYEQTGKGKEKIKVGSTTYDCNWIGTKTEFSGVKSDSKVWLSDKVPGMMVKTMVKTSAGFETITELVDFSKK